MQIELYQCCKPLKISSRYCRIRESNHKIQNAEKNTEKSKHIGLVLRSYQYNDLLQFSSTNKFVDICT